MKRWPRRPNQRPVTSRRSLAVHPKRSTSNATAGGASAVDVGLRAIEGLRLPIQARSARSRSVRPRAVRARAPPIIRPWRPPRQGAPFAGGPRGPRPARRRSSASRTPRSPTSRSTTCCRAARARRRDPPQPTPRRSSCSTTTTAMLRARAAKGIEEEVEQGVRIPVGRGFAGRVAAERRADRHPRRRPCRRPQPDPAREGDPLPPRRPPPRRGPRHRRPARRHAHPPRLHRRRPRPPAGRGRPRRARDRPRPALRARARARAGAERAVRVVEAVQRVTDAALAYLSTEDLLDELLDRMREILHADTAAILMLEQDGRVLRARAAKGIEEEVEQGVRIPVGRGFAGRIAAERRPIVDPRRRPWRRPQPDPPREGDPLASSACRCSSRAASSASSTSAPSPPATSPRPTATCSSSPPTAPRSRSTTPSCTSSAGVAEALQRTLLPQELAGVAGLELAARTSPRAGHEPGRRLVRRCSRSAGGRLGHRGRRRRRPRAAGRRADGPAAHHPARVRVRRPPAGGGRRPPEPRCSSTSRRTTMTTRVYIDARPRARGARDRQRRPPAAARDRPRRLGELPAGRTAGIALGVTRGARYREQTFAFATGSTVVLYTDGVVEVRGESLDDGLERLRASPSAATRRRGAVRRDHRRDGAAAGRRTTWRVLAARLPRCGDHS